MLAKQNRYVRKMEADSTRNNTDYKVSERASKIFDPLQVRELLSFDISGRPTAPAELEAPVKCVVFIHFICLDVNISLIDNAWLRDQCL